MPEQICKIILDALAQAKLPIAARRAFARSRANLAVSVERSLLAATPTQEQLAIKIREAAAKEIQKAESKLSPDQVEAAFNVEVSAIEAVIARNDVPAALRLVPAKELLNTLAPRAGSRNGTDLMRSLRRNFKPGNFSDTKSLSDDLSKIGT
jgi:hypothetical protein